MTSPHLADVTAPRSRKSHFAASIDKWLQLGLVIFYLRIRKVEVLIGGGIGLRILHPQR
jgi:hypothetical protein